MSKLKLETEGDRFVLATRRFDAPPDAVYRAFVEPDLIRQWMLRSRRLDDAGVHP